LHSALSHPACRQTGALIIWISVKITLTKSYPIKYPAMDIW